MREMMRRWRRLCFGYSQCRNWTGQPSGAVDASGCSGISIPLPLPSGCCEFMMKLPRQRSHPTLPSKINNRQNQS